MKILFLSRWFPYPADNGSKLRVMNLLAQLSRQHSVDLISFSGEDVRDEQIAYLKSICQRVEWVRYRPFQPTALRALVGFFSWKPRAVVDTFSEALYRQALAAAETQRYDVVIASQIDMAVYAHKLPARVRILEEMELTTIYERYKSEKNPWLRLRAALTWRKLGAYLRRLLRDFDGVTVVSEIERQRLCDLAPACDNVKIVPNGADLSYLQGDFGAPRPNTLVYTGALTYQANFDAMDYFLSEIFPLIRAGCPDAQIFITGSTARVALEKLPQQPGVHFTGYLNDIRPQVSQSWLQVVPLRVGGGTRLKILESMALGTPVVTTTKGAEGLDVHPGKDILVADTPQDFASAVLTLLHDAALRAQLVEAGHCTVRTRYNWDMIGALFTGWIEAISRKEA